MLQNVKRKYIILMIFPHFIFTRFNNIPHFYKYIKVYIHIYMQNIIYNAYGNNLAGNKKKGTLCIPSNTLHE